MGAGVPGVFSSAMLYHLQFTRSPVPFSVQHERMHVEPCRSVNDAILTYPIVFSASSAACRTFMLRSCWLNPSTDVLRVASLSAAAARRPLIITSATGS